MTESGTSIRVIVIDLILSMQQDLRVKPLADNLYLNAKVV